MPLYITCPLTSIYSYCFVHFLLNHTEKRGVTNQKHNNTGFNIYLFTCVFISLYSFQWLSSVFSFQPEELPLAFLVGKWVNNELPQHCLCRNVFNSPSFLKDSFISHRVFDDSFSPLQHLKNDIVFFFGLKDFWWKNYH